MKKMIFVFNPRSGKEQIRSKLLDILDIFTKYGYEVSVYVTQKPLDAMQIVSRRGRGRSLVVCSGGDGTLNEVVSGLMTIEEGKRPVLGYIPSGSTNDYASSIGISKNMKKAALDAVSGGTTASMWADSGKTDILSMLRHSEHSQRFPTVRRRSQESSRHQPICWRP